MPLYEDLYNWDESIMPCHNGRIIGVKKLLLSLKIRLIGLAGTTDFLTFE